MSRAVPTTKDYPTQNTNHTEIEESRLTELLFYGYNLYELLLRIDLVPTALFLSLHLKALPLTCS